jgi:four helix bundle suffix protein
MVQAARSGVRNISEGSGAAATSRKSEMKLTNVARSSLSDELLKDYESFLVQNGLRVWPKDSREARAMRARLAQDTVKLPSSDGHVKLQGLFGLPEFVEKAAPEFVANAMLCAVNQAAYLLRKQLQSQERTFVKDGGFSERLYTVRSRVRSEKSDKSDSSDSPSCPVCNKPMTRRKARSGSRTGEEFWGCTGYPACKGLRS